MPETRLSLIYSQPKKDDIFVVDVLVVVLVVAYIVVVVFVVVVFVVVFVLVITAGQRNLTLKFGQHWVNDK